ncbi:MAG: hypothetical protein HOV81_44965 [Kofleriaceae bacterium]|nr:hypothetical protein [Kofleriaceae bacterium]
MSKSNAKANRMNQESGNRNKGSEPGQEQQRPRVDRQNMGNSLGNARKATNQGQQRRKHQRPERDKF